MMDCPSTSSVESLADVVLFEVCPVALPLISQAWQVLGGELLAPWGPELSKDIFLSSLDRISSRHASRAVTVLHIPASASETVVDICAEAIRRTRTGGNMHLVVTGAFASVHEFLASACATYSEPVRVDQCAWGGARRWTRAVYSEDFDFAPLARVCDHFHDECERKPFLCSNGAVVSTDCEECSPPAQLAWYIAEMVGHALCASSPCERAFGCHHSFSALGARSLDRRGWASRPHSSLRGWDCLYSDHVLEREQGGACTVRALSAVQLSIDLSASVSYQYIPRHVVRVFAQESIERVVIKMFPSSWVHNIPFPFVEDILDDDLFHTFFMKSKSVEHMPWSYIPPSFASRTRKGLYHAALGRQQGVHSSASATAPLIDSTLDMEDHFAEALELASSGEFAGVDPTHLDFDLTFAAEQSLAHIHDLRRCRQRAAKVFCHLARRCTTASRHILAHQSSTVAAVAPEVNVVLMAIMIVVMRWPDWALPSRFVDGFRCVGLVEHTGIFMEVPYVDPPGRSQLFAARSGVMGSLRQRTSAYNSDFLLATAFAEAEAGIASSIMSEAEVVEFAASSMMR